MEESLYQKVYRLSLVKFQSDNRNVCEKYNDSDDNEWFLGSDEKGKDVCMKQCTVLIEPITESKHKRKVRKQIPK